MSDELRLDSVRPLVRYVDEEQAVIETHFHAIGPIPKAAAGFTGEADVHITIRSQDGFHDEGHTRTPIHGGRKIEASAPAASHRCEREGHPRQQSPAPLSPSVIRPSQIASIL